MADIENTGTQPVENTPTQTLFRFVSLRSPQLSDDKDQSKKFVLAPEELKANNHFYIPVTTGSESKKRLLKTAADTYKNATECIKERDFLKTLECYDFAIWLARNKDSYDDHELTVRVHDLINNFDVNNLELDLKLWNNLIYQVVSQNDFYIKEMIMQTLLALHVAKNISTESDANKILVNARVVLPRELMLDDENVSQNFSRMAEDPDQPTETFPTEGMGKQLLVSSSKMMLGRYEALKKNLSVAEKKYTKEYKASYKEEREIYESEIAPVIAQYNEDVARAKEDYCEVRPSGEAYDPEDPCRQPKEIPYPVLPKFEFDFRAEVSGQSLVESLKPNNLETVLEMLGFEFNGDFDIERVTEEEILQIDSLLEERSTFAEMVSLIEENIEKANNAIIENTETDQEAYTSIGGIILPTAKAASDPNSYQLCPQKIGRFNTFGLSVTVPDNSWDIAGMTLVNKEYGLDNNIYTSTFSYFTKSRTGNTIYLSNLLATSNTPGAMLLEIDRDFIFDFTFTNGYVAHFTVSGVSKTSCLSGYFETVKTGTETPVEVDEEEKDFIPSGFGFKNIGIADYLKVEQSTHAYVEGEVAHIENIMAREFREKSTRKLRRSENTTTASSDTEREQLNDTTTANRFEMQNEISKMMQEASDMGAYANARMQFGENYALDLGANYANHKSKEESTRQAVTQAQDVTSRAMDRIVNKIHEERIEKIIEEFEENNTHGFDNRKGDKHVVGVYRWVDKLMKNQIYNYGKRMMFEFMVPEPVKLHLLGMSMDKNATQSVLVKPQDPRASTVFKMADYSALSDESVLKYWASTYNVEIDEKPQQSIAIGKSLNGQQANNTNHIENFSLSGEIKIPDGYNAVSGKAGYSAATDSDKASASIMLGDLSYFFVGQWGQLQMGSKYDFSRSYKNDVPISATFYNEFSGSVNCMVYLELTEEAKKQWQQKTFKAIINAYEEALTDYNKRLAEEQDKAVVIKDSNPSFYRQIENTVLRKNCISYMADRATDSTHGYGLSNLTIGNTFKDYETALTAKLDKYTAFVKFMEQAFEWENLSYYLYPYYWGNKQNWTDLYQAENTDPLFRAFLQSGMARVIVTVRPGFEDAVQFYLATGKIWNGGEVPVIGDELYLSIVDEMKEPKGIKQGKPWLTRLPTTLNILQAESIGLKVAHALPFTTENPDDFEVPSEVITEDKFNFEKNDSLLGVQPSSSSDKIISGDWV